MKNILLFGGIGVILFSLVAGANFKVSSSAPTQAVALNQTQTGDFSRLTLRLAASGDSYLKNEPVPLNLRLVNETDAPIKYTTSLGLGSYLNLLVRRDGGDELRLSGADFLGGMPFLMVDPKIIHPGETKQRQELISHAVEKAFPQPGRYTVRVALSAAESEREIISNPIVVNIRQPQGSELNAYDDIKTILDPSKELTGRAGVRRRAELLQIFVNSYGSTPYGKYAAVELSGVYEVLREFQSAERELCKIRGVDFYYTDYVNSTLQRFAFKLRPMVLPANLPPGVRPALPRLCVSALSQ